MKRTLLLLTLVLTMVCSSLPLHAQNDGSDGRVKDKKSRGKIWQDGIFWIPLQKSNK